MTNYQKLQELAKDYDSLFIGPEDNSETLCYAFTTDKNLPATIYDFILKHFKTRLMEDNQIVFIVETKD